MALSIPFASYLNVRSAYAPAFDASGERIAFITQMSGPAQVWSVDRRGGWPNQLTFTDDSIGAFAWAPDGERMLFAMDRDGDERHQLYLWMPGGVEPLSPDRGTRGQAHHRPVVSRRQGDRVRQQPAPSRLLRYLRPGRAGWSTGDGVSGRRLQQRRRLVAGRPLPGREPLEQLPVQRPAAAGLAVRRNSPDYGGGRARRLRTAWRD